MKIAISTQTKNDLDSQVAGHFGKCPFFTFVEIEDGKIKSHQIIENPYFSGHEVGQVPSFIKESAADVMISGGIGGRAIQFFKEFGIGVYTGAQGTIAETIQNYLNNNLNEAAPCAESVEHGHGN